jgi:hypothetical protein
MIPEEYSLALAHTEKPSIAVSPSLLLSLRQCRHRDGHRAVVKDAQQQQELLPVAILLLLAAGLGACWIWRSLIKQYKRLLDWWYARLRELEAGLPDSARLVTREYQELYAPATSGKSVTRIGMTQRELALNWIFIGLYLVFGAGIVLSLLF